MIYEFEGRTEKEAVDRAAAELGLAKDGFDVEILEVQRPGLFKKGHVKIQVHTEEAAFQERRSAAPAGRNGNDRSTLDKEREYGTPAARDEFERAVIAFVEGIVERMEFGGKVSVLYREEHKLGLKIESNYSSILIGKKGKNLDALQLLVNIYAGRQGREDIRIILDTENYRLRREEFLVRKAYTLADQVRLSRGSVLLEPMNPFDRRLIHTTLNDISDVETKSEGEGLYKQVRIFYRGML
jgi:spoIIIJ-associated protein